MYEAISDDLLDAVRGQESANGTRLVSNKGALGPYQFLPSTFEQYKPSKDSDIMDEKDSRAAAKNYLTTLLKRYHGDRDLALAAYNHGEGNIDKWLTRAKNAGLPPTFDSLTRLRGFPEETRDYVPSVNAREKKNPSSTPPESSITRTPTTTGELAYDTETTTPTTTPTREARDESPFSALDGLGVVDLVKSNEAQAESLEADKAEAASVKPADEEPAADNEPPQPKVYDEPAEAPAADNQPPQPRFYNQPDEDLETEARPVAGAAPVAEPVDIPKPEQTMLTPEQQPRYEAWMRQHAKAKGVNYDEWLPKENADYDSQGEWLDNPNRDPNDIKTHGSDKHKFPSHVTFSTDSMYSNEKTPGGKWTALTPDEKQWSYEPSEWQLSHPGYLERLQKYWNNGPESEGGKGNKLILPENTAVTRIPRQIPDFPQLAPFSGPGSADAFKERARGLVGTPEFLALEPEEQLSTWNRLYQAGTWDSTVTPIMKQLATTAWGAIQPEKQPNFDNLLQQLNNPLPKLPNNAEDPVKLLDSWEQSVRQQMIQQGVMPSLLGNQFDDYMRKAKDSELEGFKYRTRSPFIQWMRYFGADVGRIAGSATESAISPLTGALRYNPATFVSPEARQKSMAYAAVAEEFAKTWPNFFIDSDREEALRDQNGRVIEVDGKPVPKHPMMDMIDNQIGNVIGLFGAIGTAGKVVKGLGAAAEMTAQLGAGTVVGMNMGVHEVQDEGGDTEQQWKGGLATAPGAFITSIASSMVLSSKFAAPPIFEELGRRQQTAAIAKWVAKMSLGVEGPAMVGQQWWQSTVASHILGHPVVTADKLVSAYVAGAVGGAFTKFSTAENAKTYAAHMAQQLKSLDTKLRADNVKSGTFRIPTIDENSSTDVTIFEPLSKAEMTALGERFRRIQETGAETFTLREAMMLPMEDLIVDAGMEVTPGTDKKSVKIRMRDSWEFRDGETVEAVDGHISSIERVLKTLPTEANDQEIVNRYNQLVTGHPDRWTSDAGKAFAAELKEHDRLAAIAQDRQRVYEETWGKRSSQLEYKESYKNWRDAQDALTAYDNTLNAKGEDPKQPSYYKEWRRYAGMTEELARYKGWRDTIVYNRIYGGAEEVPTGLIERTRRVAEDNLIYLLDKREKLALESQSERDKLESNKDANRLRQEHANRLALDAAGLKHIPTGVDYAKGVIVDGKYIVPFNKRWYVLSKSGLVSQASYSSFFDAARSNQTDGGYVTLAEFNKQFPAHKELTDTQKLTLLRDARPKAQRFQDILSGKIKPEAPKPTLEPGAAPKAKTQEQFISAEIAKEFPALKKKSYDERVKLVSDWADKILKIPEPPQGYPEAEKVATRKGTKKTRKGNIEGINFTENKAWRQDNPVVRNDTPGNRKWLAENKRAITGEYRSLQIDPKTLLSIPDENQIPNRISQATVDKLATSMQKEGFKERSEPLIVIDSEGTAKIFEGNHRIRAAIQAGLKTIPVDIRYEGGSEMLPGVWKPEIDTQTQSSLDARPEAFSRADSSRLIPSPPQDRPAALWNKDKPQHTRTSTEKMPPKKVMEHILAFSKWLDRDVRVRIGGSMPRGYGGYLDRLSSLAKVGRYEDIKTLVHELAGHVFDSVLVSKYKTGGDYSAIPKDVQAALRNHYDLDYGAELVEPEKQLREGFAMWMEHRLTEQATRKEIDAWFDGQFRRENPEAWQRLDALHKDIFKYYDQSPSVLRDIKATRKPQSGLSKALENVNLPWLAERFWQRYQELGRHDKETQQFIEAAIAHGIINPDEAPPRLLDQKETAQRWSAFGLNQITGRLVAADGRPFALGKDLSTMLNLQQILKSVGADKQNALVGTLMARRELMYAAHGLAMRGGNIEDSLAIVREGMADNNIRQAVHAYDEWVELQNHNIASMSPDNAAAIARRREENKSVIENAHKVDPRLSELAQFTTHPEDGMWVPMLGEEYSKIKSFRALKGSSMPAIDPRLAWGPSLIGMYKHAGERAVLSNTVARMDLAPMAAVGHIVQELTGTRAVEAAKLLQDKIKADLGADYTEHRGRVSEAMVNFLDPWIVAKEGKQGFSYFSVIDKDGKLRFFETSKSFERAVKDDLPAFTYHPLFKILVKMPAAGVRTFATSLSLPFQFKNLMRDQVTAYRWLDTQGIGAEDLIRLTHHVMSSLVDQAQFYAGRPGDSNYFARFVGMGLEHATNLGIQRHLGIELEGKFHGKILGGWEHTLNAIEAMGSLSELATRTAVARMVMEDMGKGPNDPLSPLEAVEVAAAFQRGTTNFGRQGSWTRVVNMGIPFFTANIAGLERLPSDFKRNPKKMLAMVGGGLLLGFYHAIANSDEQWYKETSIDAKMKNAWFTSTFGNVIKPWAVPLDEWTGFGWGMGQAIGNGMSKDPNLRPEIKETAKAYFGQMLSPVSSGLDLIGPVFKEGISQAWNWDPTFDRYIVPPNINYKKLEEQSTEYTTSFAKTIGKMMGWSPIRVDHAFHAMLPAAQRYWQLGDKLAATSNVDSSSSLWAFVLSARTGSKNNVMDRSSTLFYDKLFTARENQAGETIEEMHIRKKLEKINHNLSYLNQMLHIEEDQSAREELKQEKDGLLNLGLDIARGEPINVPASRWKAAAQAVRKRQRAEQVAAAQAAREMELRGATE